MSGQQVEDWANSERGPQRKRTARGQPLHCCCICGALEPWGKGWSSYHSIKDLDDGKAIPKFCSKACQKKGGPEALSVTIDMLKAAQASEWRPPKIAYRAATDREKYDIAASNQRRKVRSE